MAHNSPSTTALKLLFARSANQCSFPKCRQVLVEGNTVIGEVCHIKGARPGSARFDNDQSDTERHSEPNLVLMCRNHHTVIDDDEETYTVERLKEIKAAHQSKVSPLGNSEAEKIVEIYQHWTNIGQTGGLSAHTVNAGTINVQAGHGNGHADARRIEAIENLWKIIRNLGKEFGFPVLVDTVLTASELNLYFRAPQSNHIADCLRDFAAMNFAIQKLNDAGAESASLQRLFVTNRLWLIYSTVHALYGRTALLITNSYKSRKLADWRKDDGCAQILRWVLPEATVTELKAREFGGLRTAIDYLEGMFLAEAKLN